ncbi:hypothetical protein Ciccas_003610 [Cichlidogyrus casuarinus]|uniref:Major vault protein n=1 Tax=Cichlidogyrus casuarinus TaxID=1844966 RepID=A0ABD2QDU5_9PLAT
MTIETKIDNQVFRIPPYHFVWVLDKLTNVTRLETGPKVFIRQEHEEVVKEIEPMIMLEPQEYCVIKNPIIRKATGEPEIDQYGQVRLRHGDEEYRFHQDPFPLYPGETLTLSRKFLEVVLAECGLLLEANCNFKDTENSVDRVSGELWIFSGPGIYKPRKEVMVREKLKAYEIKPNSALRLRATKTGLDALGVSRSFGEEWLIKSVGSYLRGPYEEFVCFVTAINLDEKHALRLKAIQTHKDDYGFQRKQGTEWIVTNKMTEAHIPSVWEEVVDLENLIMLSSSEYCVILDPVDENFVPKFGKRRLLRGEKSFFLQPGESLQAGIQPVYVLAENEALILCASENVDDHKPGEKWMITGPVEYVPPVEVQVVDRRKAIPLDENEGIYVRDTRTGRVRAVTGKTYILNQDEELWEKNIPAAVYKILSEQHDPIADRSSASQQQSLTKRLDLTRVICYQVPHNAAVQIYDYKEKKARVQFGPDLVMLGPEEQFTQLSLSGGKPKRPNVIRSLCLLLGPDFCTDVVTVETADHARLSLQLSYNWHFQVEPEMSATDSAKLFSVPDFVGDCCKAIASRVRGTVAAVQFDDFHKNSARIIRSSVFGLDDQGKVKDEFVFPQNNLVITSIDVQSVEPVDQRTRDSLQKSVQLAIEITTNSQEATARHEAERLEQEARGRLERQKIDDEAEAEKARRTLLELQVTSAALESTGQAKAEAQSRAEAAKIEGQAAVESAKFKSQALDIEAEAELKRLKQAREAEMQYLEAKNELFLKRKREEISLEVDKFAQMIKSLGADNLRQIASAGPNQDVRMLKALGLQSTLITDGSSPINLLQTAHGLIGNAMGVPNKHNKNQQPGQGDDDDADSFKDDDVDLS